MSKKISQLEERSILTGDEELPVALQGSNYKVKLRNLKTLIKKADIGLGNVDNTSDLDKPVSRQTQSALNQKADLHHHHEPVEIDGLSVLLDQKANTSHQHSLVDLPEVKTALDNKSDQGHQHQIADIINLSETLADKANVGHLHAKDQILGLPEDLNHINLQLTQKANQNHQHSSYDVTDFAERVSLIIEENNLGSQDVVVTNLEW